MSVPAWADPASTDEGSGRWLQVRASTASGEIVAQIRQRLFDGDLKPGDFLGTEGSLSASFGVSRITLRDALRILEANGIVEVKVGKSGGVRVASPNPERFADALAVQLMLAGISRKEIFDAQMGVEMRAAQLAAQHATPDDLSRMAAQLARAQAQIDDPHGFVRESLQFHMALVQASHNRAIIAQFMALRHLSAKMILVTSNPERSRRVATRHGKVLDAVRRRDGATAAALVAAHFDHVINDVEA